MAHKKYNEIHLLTQLANTIVKLSRDGSCNILRNVCDGELPNDAINKGQLDGLIDGFLTRLEDIENGELIAINKEVITGTSGSITPPTGGIIELDRFDASKDAILSRVDANGNPTYETPLDGSGNPVTVSLDVNGNYITSGVYTDAEVALIYAYSIARKNFNPVDSIGYELLDLNASEVLTLLLSNPDVNVVTDNQKDALDNANTPNALNPVATINDITTLADIYAITTLQNC